jgi:prephenate dehydratase
MGDTKTPAWIDASEVTMDNRGMTPQAWAYVMRICSWARIGDGEAGYKVLEANVNKSGENTTRFAVLSKVRAVSSALTSSVLMFTVKHEAGSLANAISIIGKHGYNMTALRSRPMKKHSWQYYFYIEIDGTTDTENGKKMLEELGRMCDQLKVAGTFAPHSEI